MIYMTRRADVNTERASTGLVFATKVRNLIHVKHVTVLLLIRKNDNFQKLFIYATHHIIDGMARRSGAIVRDRYVWNVSTNSVDYMPSNFI